MFDIAKAVAAIEATRQLVITLSPHLKALATQARPVVAPLVTPRSKVLLAPGLGLLGAGIVLGAGIGLLAAPSSGAEARAKLKGWVSRRVSDAQAVRKRLMNGREHEGAEERATTATN